MVPGSRAGRLPIRPAVSPGAIHRAPRDVETRRAASRPRGVCGRAGSATLTAGSLNGRQRSQGLDVLRAAAVGLVLCRHLPAADGSAGLLRTVVDGLIRGGWTGVDLFFVISGFLVSGLLFREYQASGRIDGTRFLIRRGFRIYPSFWLFIGTTLCYMLATGDPIRLKR